MWHHFLWYHWEVCASVRWPYLESSPQKNTAFWTPLLGEGPFSLLLASSLCLQNNSRNERQIPSSLINTIIINTIFLCFKNFNRHLFILLAFIVFGFFSKSVQNIYLYEENAFICLRDIWFAYSTAVHRNSCCWLEQHSSVCKAKRFYKQISPLCLLVSLPNLNFPGVEWSSLREKTICALLMLRGIKLCRWELISVFPLSCFSAGVGFVAAPGK